MTTYYKLNKIPALFSPSWFEHFLTSTNTKPEASQMFTDINYPYNIVVEKDDADTPQQYLIEIALAGIGKNNINVKVYDNKLHINILKPDTDDDRVYLRRGISLKKSSVSFALSKDVDAKNIKSTYTDGLLRITVPCIQPETQNIDINVE